MINTLLLLGVKRRLCILWSRLFWRACSCCHLSRTQKPYGLLLTVLCVQGDIIIQEKLQWKWLLLIIIPTFPTLSYDSRKGKSGLLLLLLLLLCRQIKGIDSWNKRKNNSVCVLLFIIKDYSTIVMCWRLCPATQLNVCKLAEIKPFLCDKSFSCGGHFKYFLRVLLKSIQRLIRYFHTGSPLPHTLRGVALALQKWAIKRIERIF